MSDWIDVELARQRREELLLEADERRVARGRGIRRTSALWPIGSCACCGRRERPVGIAWPSRIKWSPVFCRPPVTGYRGWAFGTNAGKKVTILRLRSRPGQEPGGGFDALAVVLAAFVFTIHDRVLAIATVFAFGVAGYAAMPSLQVRILRKAGDAPTLSVTTTASDFNVGNTGGASLGGAVIDAGLGLGPSTGRVRSTMTGSTRPPEARKEPPGQSGVPCSSRRA